mgnify:CR=1 FL=1
MLALSFKNLIGVVLVSDATGVPVNKDYIEFSMAFSIIVEKLNSRIRTVSPDRVGGPPDEEKSA